LAGTIVAYSLIFRVIMEFEGQQHSWLTGFYWTLTVMSTLGFGDITFHSDPGRIFTIVVLVSGILMLLIVLPFTFIQSFYAPWLKAQLHTRAPRSIADDVRDHVILCRNDEIAQGLIPQLDEHEIPYVLLEADPVVAAELFTDGFSVIARSPEAPRTYEKIRAKDARLVIANHDDATNTNITITVREVTPDVDIVALAEQADSIDILELGGATHVMPLKHDLGEHLASRVTVGARSAHRLGRFEDLVIAEFPIRGTALTGRSVRDTRLRELTGLNIVGVWERGRLLPAGPDTILSDLSVPVIVGTEEQLTELDALFVIYTPNENPVLVIGGGTVGCATTHVLRERGAAVTILDADPALRDSLTRITDHVVIGDAANIETVTAAGVEHAPAVVLTTNDDAVNIYLAVYCRKLNPDALIVSRVTHEFNLDAIHRAGADFSLSHNTLAIKNLSAVIQGRERIVLSEDTEVRSKVVPEALAGKSLGESQIGALTGLNVIAVRSNGESISNPSANTELPPGGELVMIGTAEQHQKFRDLES
jgi:Trk K+ transport system NAD-binding subunit